MRVRAVAVSVCLLGSLLAARTAAEPVPAVFPVTVTASSLTGGASYRFTFGLYDVASGGTSLWSESKSYVLPASKRITHQLGSVNGPLNPISPLLLDRQLWVEARVGGRKFPRVKLGVVPYAVRSEVAGTITEQIAAGQVSAAGALAGDVLTADGGGTASWQAQAAGAGDMEAVQTPPDGGLVGGADAGTASLSLLRTCASREVLKWDGRTWACAGDTDTNSGGTVTGVTAGAGLSGGTITTSGTIAVNTATIQARVGGTCDPGNAIRAIGADGTVTCEPDDTGAAGSGWQLSGNAGTTGGTNYLGTSDNQPLDLRVNGVRALRAEPTSGTPNLVGGFSGNAATAPVTGAAIGGGGRTDDPNRVTDDFGSVGGGARNVVGNDNASAGDADFATVGGGYDNQARAQWATVGGGRGNAAGALLATVAGGWINSASGNYSTAGGGQGNSAAGEGSTVAGGQQNTGSGQLSAVGGGYQNTATGMHGAVAGGFHNQVTGQAAAIGGGQSNLSTDYGTAVAGGLLNEATARAAVVGGGQVNKANGEFAAVGGGTQNVAGGAGAAVPGGRYNQAGGDTSLAAGYWAVVRDAATTRDADGDEGTFVWADAQGVPFLSTGPNQFLVRAQGGVGINRNDPATALDVNGTVTASGLRLTTAPAAGRVLTSDASGNGSWQPAAGSGGGTVTQVATGAGLAGGSITGAGTISVATGGIATAMIADGAVTDVKIAGPIGTAKLSVGTAPGTVAAGDHAHAGMGDIASIDTPAGSGLTGGANSGAVSLAVDTAAIQARVAGACAPGSSIRAVAADGTVACEPDDAGDGSTWSLAGNSGTNPATNFIGTTDDVPLELRVSNQRALRLERATATIGDSTFEGQNLVGGDAGNWISPGVTMATISGGGGSTLGNAAANRVTDLGGTVSGGWNNQAGNGAGTLGDAEFSTVGGGQYNMASGGSATVAGGFGNTASGAGAIVAGGTSNSASGEASVVVGGGFNAAQRYAFIGGGSGHAATGDSSVIGGGASNMASGWSAAVAGGAGNTASGEAATVAGGAGNTASGLRSTVGGGSGQTASDRYATIGGGVGNAARGPYATVSGGVNNAASGSASTVAGGSFNAAGGTNAFAAGYLAIVRDAAASGDANGDEGTFVWADFRPTESFVSTGPNQFLVRAQGGVGINRNNPSSALDVDGTVTASGLRLTTAPAAGHVLTSDALGNGSWQPGAAGDITAVTTADGSGLTGGAGSGDVSLAVDTARIQARVGGTCAPGNSIRAIGADGTVTCEPDDTGGGGSGWALSGNEGTDPATNFVGTTDDVPLELRVNNQRALRLESAFTSVGVDFYVGQNVLGGDAGNWVGPYVAMATIAGGGGTISGAAAANRVTDVGGTVGGGSENQAGAAVGTPGARGFATVGGGQSNTASGSHGSAAGGLRNTASGDSSAIGGGIDNVASGVAATVAGGSGNTVGGSYSNIGGGMDNSVSATASTVAGGSGNTASAVYASVVGGSSNTASGYCATVAGGWGNVAGGNYSFAGGLRATVRTPAQSGDSSGDEGTFVWTDSQWADFTSTGPDQFLVRAAGGVGINKNNPASALDVNGTITTGELVVNNMITAGNLLVTGTVSKGGGSFKIDHPLDPRNRYLSHSFVESPDMMNVYNGNVTTDGRGYATVELPAWFGALNRDFRYQLTVIGGGEAWARARIAGEVDGNRFVIQTDVPGTKVSWQVTGIRQDPYANAHRIPIEEEKPVADRGKCLHAEACGEQLAQGK